MTVERLFLSPARGAEQVACQRFDLLAGQGITGDRHCGRGDWAGQQLTLVEAEEIERFCAATGREVDLSLTRRNIVTRGVRLNDLVGQHFRIGNCLLLGIERCEPCRTLGARLENASLDAAGVVKYWVGRGGLRADVIVSDALAVGDRLSLITPGKNTA